MDKVVGSIAGTLERLLRWVYPGALFLILLYVSDREAFVGLQAVHWPWGLILLGLVAGFVVYLFQANIVTQALSLVALSNNWVANALVAPPREASPIFDGEARAILRRWGHSRKRLNSYLDYSWAGYHATSITGWLPLAFLVFGKWNCLPPEIEFWISVLSPLFLVFALLRYFQLTRVRFPGPVP